MRAKVKTAWRQASKLHGATAGFVSLVDRGANETPFKEIKSTARKGTDAMSIKKRTDLAKSHKKLTTGKKEAPKVETKTIMAKMVFDQDHFEDEASVQDWLAKAEWDAEKVEITDDGEGNYVARPDGTTDKSFTKMASVEVDDEGVSAFVGTIEVKTAAADDADADDEDDEDDDAGDDDDDGDDDDAEEEAKAAAAEKAKAAKKAPVKKAASTPAPVTMSKRAAFIAKAKESIAKFSPWDAFYAKKNSLVEALKAGMECDATPPGFYDVQSAFNGVVQAILGDDAEGVNKAEALTKAAGDYADLLVGMDTYFDGFINAGDETVKKAVGDHAEKIAKWAEGYVAFLTEGVATPEKKAETVKKAAPAAADATAIADLIAKAVSPLTDKIDTVTATVTKLADRRPTKKAADLTDAGDGERKVVEKSSEEKTSDWLASKHRKALM